MASRKRSSKKVAAKRGKKASKARPKARAKRSVAKAAVAKRAKKALRKKAAPPRAAKRPAFNPKKDSANDPSWIAPVWDDALLLGAHVSIAGGTHEAPPRGKAIGASAMQIFTKMGSRWAERLCPDDECQAFRVALDRCPCGASARMQAGWHHRGISRRQKGNPSRYNHMVSSLQAFPF